MCQLSVHPRELLSTFCACAGLSGDFRQLLCIRGTFRELSIRLRDLLSTFCPCAGPWVDFRQLCASVGTSVKFPCFRRAFHLLSVWQRDFPSSSNNFPYIRGIFCQLPLTSVRPQYLPSTSVNFLCTRGIFRKQSAWPQNLPSTSVDFPCICGTYHKLASTFCEAGDLLSTFRLAS